MKKVKEKTELEALIETRMSDLQKATDPNERKAITEDLTKLYEMRLKECEATKKDADKIFSYIKLAIDASAVVLPLCFYVILFYAGLKFEETGHITSNMMRNLMGKFKLTK